MTLRSHLIRLAHNDPTLRSHLLPILKSAGDFDRDFDAAIKEVRAIVERYKHHQRGTLNIPSGPDTSKFVAPSYGDVEVVNGGIGYVSFAIGVRVGTNFAAVPYDTRSDRDMIRAVTQQSKVVADLKQDVRKVIDPLAAKYPGMFRYEEGGGSAYSYFGLANRKA